DLRDNLRHEPRAAAGASGAEKVDRASHLGEVSHLVLDVDERDDLGALLGLDVTDERMTAVEDLEETETGAAFLRVDEVRRVGAAQNLLQLLKELLPGERAEGVGDRDAEHRAFAGELQVRVFVGL